MSLTTIGEHFKIKGGKRLPKGERLTSIKTTHPYIRIADFQGHSIDVSNIEYVENKVHEKIKRYIVNSGDLIISIVGTTGLLAIVPDELDKANLTENCAKLIPLDQETNVKYLYYFLSSKIGQHIIQSFVVGSTQPKLPLYGISDIYYPIIDIKEQQAIAKTLSLLDDKISLLRQQNETLEQLAQTLFKRWFVDFEFPDAQGQPYKSAGGKMIESELGEIPEGWEVSTIDKITLKVTDGTHSTVIDNSKGEYYLLSCKNIKNGLVLTSSKDRKIDFDTLKQLRKRTGLSKNDILITTVGTIGQAAILRKDQIPFELQRSVAIIRPNTDLVLPEYLYQLIRSRYFQHEAISRSEGSVQTCLFLGAIKSIEVILPNYNIIQQFNFLLQATYQKFENNLNEIQTLTRLRDTLLPKLMSGELRLGE